MTVFRAPSPRTIAARWHGGSQNPNLIVLHSTVGPTKAGSAVNVAHFFATEDNKTSAHYCVDAAEVIQCVGDHTVAYHCGYNQDSIGIEMCDMAGDNLARWSDADHKAMAKNAQTLVAQLCLAYNIRPYYVSRWGLLLGRKGVTTHAQMSLAYKRSTHTDPGAWPKRAFMRGIRAEVARIKAEAKTVR